MKKNILIVEDNEANIRFFEESVVYLGYTPELTSTGFDAVNHVKKKKPDLILMDYNLPGINGVTTLKKIKAIYPDIKIIAITACSMLKNKKWFLKQGFDSYLKKPVSLADLKSELDQFLE